jgi:hypothetical protein
MAAIITHIIVEVVIVMDGGTTKTHLLVPGITFIWLTVVVIGNSTVGIVVIIGVIGSTKTIIILNRISGLTHDRLYVSFVMVLVILPGIVLS